MPLVRAGPATLPPAQGGLEFGLDDLASADADIRRRAASALGHHEARQGADEQTVAALAERLHQESDAGVREAIFAALSAIGGASAAAQLSPFLRLDDAGLRNGALETLKRLGGDAVAALDDLLADPDADVRLFAVEVMRAWPPALATPRLAATLAQETDVNVIGMTLDVAAVAGDASLLPALAGCEARFAGDYFIAFAAAITKNALDARPAPPPPHASPAAVTPAAGTLAAGTLAAGTPRRRKAKSKTLREPGR